ncbi:beta ketoadipyl CoA thiolase [Zalerion maritima]|uniref:Beta ketoadipyl CoA thiolase n=1 Tax=Zalerion maritima TaxID=339359 RepID=A0AAD5RKJ3_9PEZI|nr:beta ketoadipyl CoA thiolase [Zalerion maritima]
MKFTIAVATLFFGASLGAPAPGVVEVQKRQTYDPCSGLYDSAQCCATDVLGIADLDCGDPPEVPTNATDFSAVCAAIGQRARCCVLPILDQGILCNTPAGVDD